MAIRFVKYSIITTVHVPVAVDDDANGAEILDEELQAIEEGQFPLRQMMYDGETQVSVMVMNSQDRVEVGTTVKIRPQDSMFIR